MVLISLYIPCSSKYYYEYVITHLTKDTMKLQHIGKLDYIELGQNGKQYIDQILTLIKNKEGQFEITNHSFEYDNFGYHSIIPYHIEKYGGFGEGISDMTPR